MPGQRPPGARVGGERAVLGDARAQGGHVLVLGAAEAVFLEAPRGLLGGAGARQHEDGTVLEPEVTGVMLDRALGEVECSQQLAAALLREHGLAPLRRGVAGARSLCLRALRHLPPATLDAPLGERAGSARRARRHATGSMRPPAGHRG